MLHLENVRLDEFVTSARSVLRDHVPEPFCSDLVCLGSTTTTVVLSQGTQLEANRFTRKPIEYCRC